ncbi:MAG: single-stranded DNA-binding protein [Chloroflexi bacterium]|nr:single-stranded DNA-binding protein [Chloroflexota bacterium]MDA1226599.1 single-stranded DNA-binding protein [Chloroflexota bacterium]
MVGLNKMIAIGNVGTDPEMRYTPNGNPVTSFRLATGRSYTASDGERKQETEWFTVVAWNQLAEQCNQFLAKGRRVYVEGRIKSNTWTGQDGQSRFRNEIIANRVIFLDRTPSSGSFEDSGTPAFEGEEDPAMAVGDAEDLPW